MAKVRDWTKVKRKPTQLELKQISEEYRAKAKKLAYGHMVKHLWSSETWQALRARTQALADAAAPKPSDDDGKVP